MARSKDLKVNITGDADKLDKEVRQRIRETFHDLASILIPPDCREPAERQKVPDAPA